MSDVRVKGQGRKAYHVDGLQSKGFSSRYDSTARIQQLLSAFGASNGQIRAEVFRREEQRHDLAACRYLFEVHKSIGAFNAGD
jgi:hypothetical protein